MKKQTSMAIAALILFLAAATGLVATLPLAAEAEFSRLKDMVHTAPIERADEGAFLQTAVASAKKSVAALADARFPTDENTTNRLALHYAENLKEQVMSDLGVEIPDSAAHAGNFQDGSNGPEFFLSLGWTDARHDSMQVLSFFENFDEDFENGDLVYYYISDLDETAIGPMIDAAREAFSSQLGIGVPDDTSLETIVMRFANESGSSISVFLYWRDPAAEMAQDPLSSIIASVYSAHYGNADPRSGTGNLMLLEKTFIGSPQLGVNEAPEYSEAEKDAAIQAARAFAEGISLTVGETQIVHPIPSDVNAGLTVVLATSDGLSVLISVTNGGEVIGYSLRSNILEDAKQYRVTGS